MAEGYTTLDRVMRIIQDLSFDDKKITKHDRPADIGIDSLDVIDMVMTFEEEFSIEITDMQAEKMEQMTFQEIADQIKDMRKSKK